MVVDVTADYQPHSEITQLCDSSELYDGKEGLQAPR